MGVRGSSSYHGTGARAPRAAFTGKDGLERAEVHRMSDALELDPGTLRPAPRGAPPTPPRVVGPGRLELRYRGRIEALERELEAARLVERGASRRLDRIERTLASARAGLEEARRLERRLLVSMGALASENAALRAEVQRLAAAPAPALAPPRKSLVARLLGRRARRPATRSA